ncbi:MAG: hypothetical protein ACRD9L_11325, partial [Bryobacteraceae bacterium]
MTNPKELQEPLDFTLLFETIAANRNLLGRLRASVAELNVTRPPFRAGSQSPLPEAGETRPYAPSFRPSSTQDPTDRRIVEALLRQHDDPSLAGYPDFPIRLAARVYKIDGRLPLPGDDE